MNKEYVKLPNAWEWRKLGDVCEKITDGSHFSPKATETGYPYITVKDVNDEGKIDFKNCLFISEDDFCKLKASSCNPLKNDVLFSKDGTVGKVSIVDFAADFVVLSSLAILRPSKKLDSYYLAYAMKNPSFLKYAEDKKTGAAIKRVVLRTIKEFHIPLPPLEEQKRIVQKLDGLFAKADKAIALLDESIASASALLPSVLNEVFDLEVIEKWGKFQFDKIAKFIDYRGKTPVKTEYGIILITAKNVRFGYLSKEPKEFIASEAYDGWMTRGIPKAGDILFTTEAPLGNVALLDTNEKRAFAQRLVTFQKISDDYDSKFLYWYLLSPIFQKELNDSATGTTVKGIKASVLKKFEIPLPPLNIQTEVVAHLDAVRDKSERLSAKLKVQRDELVALKASLLDKAFKGEL